MILIRKKTNDATHNGKNMSSRDFDFVSHYRAPAISLCDNDLNNHGSFLSNNFFDGDDPYEEYDDEEYSQCTSDEEIEYGDEKLYGDEYDDEQSCDDDDDNDEVLEEEDHQCVSLNYDLTFRRVAFSTVKVREYNVVVGDHLYCREGLPLSLGWEYSKEKVHNINAYEYCRRIWRKKDRWDLRLSAEQRRELLLGQSNYAAEELDDMERQINAERQEEDKRNKKFSRRLFSSIRRIHLRI
mmetsp:Transcript_9898/g.15311  ORF Transcript_9898/g.15311 Transcript_9898/m.15311 type:complete len:240 (+) Transcript_9898:53-772(+)